VSEKEREREKVRARAHACPQGGARERASHTPKVRNSIGV